MAYNPALPANNAPIVSTELRSQFGGLKDIIDTKADVAQVEEFSAGPCLAVEALSVTASNPPTQAEVQAVIDKFNELLTYLQRV